MAERPSEGAAAAAEAKKPPAEEKPTEKKDNQASERPKTETKQSVDIFDKDSDVYNARKDTVIAEEKLKAAKLKKELEDLNKKEGKQAETNPEKTGQDVAKAVAHEAQSHSSEIAHNIAPTADKETHKKIVSAINKEAKSPGFFRRAADFVKENKAAIVGGFAAGGTKAALRIAGGVLISPSFLTVLGIGALAGGSVEGVREYYRQGKKLESLDEILGQMETETDLVKKAAVINRLEKLQDEARIKKDETQYNDVANKIIAAKTLIMAEMRRKDMPDSDQKVKQLNYLLRITSRARQETPKTLRKETEKMLKDLEKSWKYDKWKWGDRDKAKIAKAALRGAIVGGTAGAFGYGLSEYVLPYASEAIQHGWDAARGVGSSVKEVVQDKVVTTALEHSTVPMHDTVWQTAHEILNSHGVETTNENINQAMRIITESNHIAIAADHAKGALMDIHMQQAHALEIPWNQLSQAFGSHGWHAGSEVVTRHVSETVIDRAAIASAEHGTSALLDSIGYGTAVAAGIAANKGLRQGAEDRRIRESTGEAGLDVDNRIKELNREDAETYLVKLSEQFAKELSRDVNLNIVASTLSHEDLSKPEIQEKIGEIISLLKEPQFARKLGGFDISFGKGGNVVRMPYVYDQRPGIIIPVDQDINATREQLLEVVKPMDVGQLRDMYKGLGDDAMEIGITDPNISDRINESLANNEFNDDLGDLDEILFSLDPALVKKIGRLTLGGRNLNANFPKNGKGEINIPYPYPDTKEMMVAMIEDAAEAQGVKFERSQESVKPTDLKQATERLLEGYNQLGKEGSNKALFEQLENEIAGSGKVVTNYGIHAEMNLSEVVHDTEQNEYFVPPAIKKMFLMKQQLGLANDLLNRTQAPGATITDNDRYLLRHFKREINELLAPGTESIVMFRETVANDLVNSKKAYENRIKDLSNIDINLQSIPQSEITKWSLRKQLTFYSKIVRLADALGDSANDSITKKLKKNTLILSQDMSADQRAIMNKGSKTFQLRADLSVAQMMDALAKPEQVTVKEEVGAKEPKGYSGKREALEAVGISVNDAVLLEKIGDLEKPADRKNKFSQFEELYTKIAADPDLTKALKHKFLFVDNVPAGKNRTNVDKNKIHVSIDNNNTATQAFNALKAEMSAPAPAGAGGKKKGP